MSETSPIDPRRAATLFASLPGEPGSLFLSFEPVFAMKKHALEATKTRRRRATRTTGTARRPPPCECAMHRHVQYSCPTSLACTISTRTNSAMRAATECCRFYPAKWTNESCRWKRMPWQLPSISIFVWTASIRRRSRSSLTRAGVGVGGI